MIWSILVTMNFQRALRLAPLASVSVLLVPLVAVAQLSTPSYATREEVIRGTISGFNGAYTMYVRDQRGFVDTITLRQGTIINPTGVRLSEGQRVTVIGFAHGKTLIANQIDTPYLPFPPPYYGPPFMYPPPPPAAYYPPPYW
jgi:hypothetical protein